MGDASVSPKPDAEIYDLYEIDDLEEDPSQSLIRIATDPPGTARPRPASRNKAVQLLKRVFLFQFCGFKGTLVHVVAFYLFLLAGLSALIGISMDIAIEKLLELRVLLVDYVPWWPLQVPVWVAYTLVGVTLAFFWTRVISVTANGSGVPEMKCTLLGNHLPNLLSFRTLLGKIVGLVLTIGTGMWAGKEGPFIHIAGCIASQLTHLPFFHFLRDSKELFTQMLSTAAACGVSSNFGTPIGGLLFSVEVTATYYPVRNYWFGTFSSVIAALILRAVYGLYRGQDEIYAGIMAIDYTFPMLRLRDMGLSVAVGIVCGVIAVLFITLISFIFKGRKALRRFRIGRVPYLYLVLVAVMTSLSSAPWGGFNPLGMSSNQTLELLISNKPLNSVVGSTPVLVLGVMLLARFLLTAMSISVPVPVGLFTTTIVIGSILGRFCGETLELVGFANDIGPSGLAIVGGACFVGAVTQTFSSAILMIELIDNIQLFIPVLIAIVVSICLTRLMTVSVYDQIMIDRELPYIPDIQYSSHQTAEMVMDVDVVPVPEFTNLVELKEIAEQFKTCDEQTLPVVNNLENGILLGDVKLSAIRRIIDEGIPESVAGRFLLQYNECPLHILRHTPLSEIHMLFIAAQIDSAFVTNNGRLIGEINKKCLSFAIEKQMKILI